MTGEFDANLKRVDGAGDMLARHFQVGTIAVAPGCCGTAMLNATSDANEFSGGHRLRSGLDQSGLSTARMSMRSSTSQLAGGSPSAERARCSKDLTRSNTSSKLGGRRCVSVVQFLRQGVTLRSQFAEFGQIFPHRLLLVSLQITRAQASLQSLDAANGELRIFTRGPCRARVGRLGRVQTLVAFDGGILFGFRQRPFSLLQQVRERSGAGAVVGQGGRNACFQLTQAKRERTRSGDFAAGTAAVDRTGRAQVGSGFGFYWSTFIQGITSR
jgi:hypothetical protein